jgi:hypothetical protein
MTKLTDTQLVLLSAASQHPDGVIPISERLKGGVATSVGEKLIALGLAEERVAVPPMNIWRETAEGQRVVLVITPLGLAAVGIEAEDGSSDAADGSVYAAPATRGTTTAPAIAPAPNPAPDLPATAAGRSGTKKAQVIELLQQEGGASINDIVVLTGWLPHTTRAALTGLRKTGMTIEMVRQAGSATRYRIAGQAGAGEA